MSDRKPNYRLYDGTGGNAKMNIWAANLGDAIEQGRQWIETGDWRSEDGVIRKGVTLDACVREIATRPADPLDRVFRLRWDLWSPEWDKDSTRWGVDVSDIEAKERADVAEALSKATGGLWTYQSEGERCIWVEVPADWETEDITDEQDPHDCSGSHSDDEPQCDEGGGDDDGGHDWRSPHQLVGGLKDNPGFYSLGGTMISHKSVCARCGSYRTEVTAGCQRNAGDPEATVEYQAADEASQAWMIRTHEDDGWIPKWLAERLERPPTTRYTVDEARQWVNDHSDDDELDSDELDHVFGALAGRQPDAADRAQGLWSLCAQLVA